MTLRVNIEIVPFGVEEDKRTIEVLNISNIGRKMDSDYCVYGIEQNKYKTGKYDAIVTHKRSLGALALVVTAIEELLQREGDNAESTGT